MTYDVGNVSQKSNDKQDQWIYFDAAKTNFVTALCGILSNLTENKGYVE